MRRWKREEKARIGGRNVVQAGTGQSLRFDRIHVERIIEICTIYNSMRAKWVILHPWGDEGERRWDWCKGYAQKTQR